MDVRDVAPFHSKATGFTVIELLTVVAIIALLAAILMPVLATAKRTALRTQCLANLHNIGLAFDLYGADYSDYYPWAIDRYTRDHPQFLPGSLTDQGQKFPDIVGVLSVYSSRLSGTWRCPSDSEPYQASADEALTGLIYPSYFAYAGTSYAFWPAWYVGLAQTSLPQPISPLARDMNPWHCEYPDPDIYTKSQNDLFPDGHARFASPMDHQ